MNDGGQKPSYLTDKQFLGEDKPNHTPWEISVTLPEPLLGGDKPSHTPSEISDTLPELLMLARAQQIGSALTQQKYCLWTSVGQPVT